MEDCSKMCIYVQNPLTESAPMLVHPTPAGSYLDSESGNGIMDGTIREGGGAAFYSFPYHANIDYTTAAAPNYPNHVYSTKGPHPSETITGYDNDLSKSIYMDQHFSVGTSSSGWSKSIEGLEKTNEYYKRGFGGDGEGHFFGYATCQWLATCDGANDVPGTPCSSTNHQGGGVDYDGFCFRSAYGTLECGRLSAMDDEYGENPIAFDARSDGNGVASVVSPNKLPSEDGVVKVSGASLTVVPSTPGASGTVYRCPSGSPAKGPGAYVSKRLLVAGCMNTADANYDALAEVHVPGYCVDESDYMKGCLIPWATNYDPTAKQSGTCHFFTKGCTSKTAVNYNPHASHDDPDYPCIEAVEGCTVNDQSYHGVPSDIPGYQEGYVPNWAVSGTRTGIIEENAGYTPQIVLNYDSTANVNVGCVVAVEGCMDPTAVNYDQYATTQANTWCVPAVVGCMMPDVASANAAFSAPDGIDGLNGNFSIFATIHDPDACVIARFGCNADAQTYPGYVDPIRAINYDPRVTVNSACYWPKSGCLNPNAVNFRCDSDEATEPCTGDNALEDAVTQHVKYICKYSNTPSPPAPSPPPFPENLPSDATVEYLVTTVVVFGGTIDYWTNTVLTEYSNLIRDTIVPEADRATANVTSVAEAGSVIVTSTYNTPDADSAEAALATAQEELSTMSDVQAILGDQLGVTALTGADVQMVIVITVPKKGLGAGAIIGIVIGVLAAIGLGVGGYKWNQKRKQKAVFPA